MTDTTSAPVTRPFQTGDHVHASYRMIGCQRSWWGGNGRIIDIISASPDNRMGIRLPAVAVLDYDAPVPCPCTAEGHDHTGDASDGWAIPLNKDMTAPAFDDFRLSLTDQEPPA